MSKYNAECVRRVANWTKITSEHKFDKPSFKPAEVLKVMEDASPKMVALLDNIKALDAEDMKREGKMFKHFIFSDVKQGGYGAKIITSALLASGFSLAYDKRRKLVSDTQLLVNSGKNVALLSSTSVFDDTINTKTKKEILAKFNQRPDNVHGELIRLVVLDSGFKEGIDLFDVKYVHVFEPQTSKADMKQVIGRGTRTCGQKGLEFHPTQGWPLHVFLYDVKLPEDMDTETMFTLYIESTGIDLRKMRLADEIEKYSIIASVDYELNKNIHNFELEYDAINYFDQIFSGGARTQKDESGNMEVKCDGKCGSVRKTKDVPLGTPAIITAFFAIKMQFPKRQSKPREFLCKELKTNPTFCKAVKQMYVDPVAFVKKHARHIKAALGARHHMMIPAHMRRNLLRFIYGIIPQPAVAEPKVRSSISSPSSSTNSPTALSEHSKLGVDNSGSENNTNIPQIETHIVSSPPQPGRVMKRTFLGVREYVRENFAHLAWPKVNLENMCGGPTMTSNRGGADVMRLTPTQEFVSTFFTPRSPQKGMLLHHSVGTGKTCCAIATATTSFEPEGYTILWVTRTTLKGDIWKNMFDQVCSSVIKSKFGSDPSFSMPITMDARMKLLSPSWSIRPMSYKQFSNLVSGSNSMYQQLVKKNGTTDPLRKTLLIIDEAHKLYGGDDLSSVERPDMRKLHAAIMKSYDVSGDESVRLLLMTATPFTNDPLELVQLLNLFRLRDDQLPVEFDAFSHRYLTKEGIFTKRGKRVFLDDVAGYISYLNRERDARQFAQPQITPVTVSASISDTSHLNIDDVKKSFDDDMHDITKQMKQAQQAISETRKRIMADKKAHDERCKSLQSQARAECVHEAKVRNARSVTEFESMKQRYTDDVDTMKQEIKSLKQQKIDMVKRIQESVDQVSILNTKCVINR